MPLLSQTRARSGWCAAANMVGPIAARALRPGARGRVRAVFERCFYVELDSGWVCVGGAGMGAGPLNLNWGWFNWGWSAAPSLPALPRSGEVARIDGTTLTAGPAAIALAAAEPWVAERVGAWDQASLARGLAAADTALTRLAPRDGLALLGPADSCQRRALLAAAQAPLAHLAQLLGGEPAGQPIDAARLAPLIGLGPGLTPSGDDYLGGLMVALSLVGRCGLRDRLWQAVQPLTIERTTAISRVHLAAAAEGLGSAALHAALAAILSGASDRMAAACAGLARVGHSSGWDSLAGALGLLRAS
jgi:hypothetical protein